MFVNSPIVLHLKMKVIKLSCINVQEIKGFARLECMITVFYQRNVNLLLVEDEETKPKKRRGFTFGTEKDTLSSAETSRVKKIKYIQVMNE